jgi:hypothetical protein
MESGRATEAKARLARHAQCQMRCRGLWQELQRQRTPSPPAHPSVAPSPSHPLGPGRRTPRPPTPPLADPVLPLEGIEDEIERELAALRLELAAP